MSSGRIQQYGHMVMDEGRKSPVFTELYEGLWVLIGFYYTGKLWWPGPLITLVNTCPDATLNCTFLG